METIARLQTNTVLVFQDVIELFNIYTSHIRPFICEALNLEKTTLFIKKDKKWFLVNNFELFHLIKSPNVGFNVLKQKVSVRYITRDDFNFDLYFYELIELIAKHKKKLDIKLIYKHLKKILDKQMTQRLFSKNIFAATKFCELINITEHAYHARRSGVSL